jgi:hypothetical protein
MRRNPIKFERVACRSELRSPRREPRHSCHWSSQRFLALNCVSKLRPVCFRHHESTAARSRSCRASGSSRTIKFSTSVAGMAWSESTQPRSLDHNVFGWSTMTLPPSTARSGKSRSMGPEGVKVLMSDGFRQLREIDFTKILCNPPYHVDFSMPKHLLEKGFNRLVIDNAMHFVTKRRAWYENKLRSIFGNVRVRELDSYFVFEAIRRSQSYANAGR